MHWRLVGRFYTSAGRETLRRLPEQWHRCEFLLDIMVGWIAFVGALIRNLPIVPIHFPFPCLKCWKKNLHSDWFHWQGNSPLLWRWLCFANAILQTSAWFQLNRYPTQARVAEGTYEDHSLSCNWCPYLPAPYPSVFGKAIRIKHKQPIVSMILRPSSISKHSS